MKKLKIYTILGIIFVIALGSLAHFFYEWSNNNFLIGLFTPVNESTWEHMKLIFFPMLLFSLIYIPKLKETYPCIISAFPFGLLTGTFLIPVFFYTYTGFLGYNVFILDILSFVFAVITAFYTIFKSTISCKVNKYTNILCIIVYILSLCFFIFTLWPLNIGLFAIPK